ncbi:pyridoxamine 5'-phosphate oxidase [Limimaricola litoreus]|uniref:Pyridoxine/pyridoxamine 5'-phosphate oxidase n=1 Tax=Limimaricola litoreus TaxID=2955316 RepID=A0A9X2FT87_9RHOB|nr:pyridoxamine 5'-phosphate oxidase [Limimaricola litoreus]MCP1169915.1 pyridoxamine 5'-phosphate oxidase [Limimaricola litoreus]
MDEDRGIFAGEDPFAIARRWLAEAEGSEPSDANAAALSTVDETGLPDVRVVLIKQIEDNGFVFFTNYESAKARQIEATGQAALVFHWKSLRRQIRVRGRVEREDGPQADAYYRSRALESRIGAWASPQSRPIASRAELEVEVARLSAELGEDPPRPPFWGGYRIRPLEMEFWADGAHRLHDRYKWARRGPTGPFDVLRLGP